MTTWTILTGDVRERLRDLPESSVQCVVTSPPYWGLRDYGTGTWEGGAADCQHSVGGQVQDSKAPGAITAGVRPGVDASRCRKCGARRIDQQIGLEATPEQFVAEMVQVFREVRRVLKDDGTLFLNLGDSYAMSTKGSSGKGEKQVSNAGTLLDDRRWSIPAGLKPKDLVGIPWMVAFALRADGWWLRQDIIWHKPNPMPESVTDRCTKAHEYLFLLSKNAKYYYDADVIREPHTGGMSGGRQYSQAKGLAREKRNPNGQPDGQGHNMYALDNPNGRNRRSVWTIPTQPYSGAHFATFPEALVEPCILAGSREGDTVLDPFTGSGTTGAVAMRLNRHFLGCELNDQYVQLARTRIGSVAPLLTRELP